jgi:hypothetical protein
VHIHLAAIRPHLIGARNAFDTSAQHHASLDRPTSSIAA